MVKFKYKEMENVDYRQTFINKFISLTGIENRISKGTKYLM